MFFLKLRVWLSGCCEEFRFVFFLVIVEVARFGAKFLGL